jgi:hypothetical protein
LVNILKPFLNLVHICVPLIPAFFINRCLAKDWQADKKRLDKITKETGAPAFGAGVGDKRHKV